LKGTIIIKKSKAQSGAVDMYAFVFSGMPQRLILIKTAITGIPEPVICPLHKPMQFREFNFFPVPPIR